MKTVDKEFSDCRLDRLQEDMYSREEVEDILDFMQSAMRSMVSHDIGTLVNMSAIVVGEMLEDARAKGAQLEIDTSRVENEKLLEAMERMNLEAMPKSKMRVDALPSFKKEAKALRDEQARLSTDNKSLENQLRDLERSAMRLNTEKVTLLGQIESLKAQIDESAESGSKTSDEDASRVRRLEDELNAAREETEKRVSETNQFQQMRKMMQTQSAKLRELRTKLAKYEPDEAEFKD